MEDAIDQLQQEVRRGRALLHATQGMLCAVFESLPKAQQEAILQSFTSDSADTHGLLLAEPEFSDEEIDDDETATDFVRKTMVLSMQKSRS